MDILKASSGDLGRAVSAGSLSPVEICETYLDAISASPHKDSIYSEVTAERALSEANASAARQKSGALLGPLDGVPVSWKDLFDSAGVETRAGTNLLKGRVPQKDCKVMRLGSEAGMPCLGKTHLSELAFSGLGINPSTATPPNFYREDCAPGGSSSGAAASVAFDLAPIAIGSDTGGSVRIPACWNGLVGLKTTHGAISLEGVVPLCASFDTVGPLARNVEDAALMFEVLSGQKVSLNEGASLSDMRFLVCEATMLDHCEDDQQRAFESAVDDLSRAGATIERGTIPLLEDMLPLGKKMFPFEAYAQWGEMIETAPEKMFKPVLNRFRGGIPVSAAEDREARSQMMVLRQKYATMTKRYDAVLAPTIPIGAPLVKPLLEDHDLFWDVNLNALSNTRHANMLGLCALTLPTNTDMAGIMFFGQGGGDARLLQVGQLAERAIKR